MKYALVREYQVQRGSLIIASNLTRSNTNLPAYFLRKKSQISDPLLFWLLGGLVSYFTDSLVASRKKPGS